MTIDVTKPNIGQDIEDVITSSRENFVATKEHINNAASAHGIDALLTSKADYETHKANKTNAHGMDTINANIAAAQTEISTARGSKTTLANRLSAGLNNDGTLKLSSLNNTWIDNGDIPTYLSPLSFSVTNDRTKVYLPGVIIRATVAGGYVYGVVATCAYTTVTTIQFNAAYPVLNSPISKIELGILAFDQAVELAVAQNSADILNLQSQMAGLSYLGTGGYGTLTWEDEILSYEGNILEI